jgi:uncharacterized CHY-type Zn-finger protein
VNGTARAASKRHDTRDVLRCAHIISLSLSSAVVKDALKTPRSPACALAAQAGAPFTLRMAHRLPPQSGEDNAFSTAPRAPTAAPTHMSPIPVGAKHKCHGVGIPKHSFAVLMSLPLQSRASSRAAGESESVSVSPCSRICQRAFKPSLVRTTCGVADALERARVYMHGKTAHLFTNATLPHARTHHRSRQQVGLKDYTATRCSHWHGDLDVLALQAPCCGRFYACAQCHDEVNAAPWGDGHTLEPWPAETELSTQALLCGVCKNTFSIQEYVVIRKLPMMFLHSLFQQHLVCALRVFVTATDAL